MFIVIQLEIVKLVLLEWQILTLWTNTELHHTIWTSIQGLHNTNYTIGCISLFKIFQVFIINMSLHMN